MAIEDAIKAFQASSLQHPAGAGAGAAPADHRTGQLAELTRAVRQRLMEVQGVSEWVAAGDRDKVRALLWQLIEEEADRHGTHLLITAYEKSDILERLLQMIFGLGIIEPLLRDPAITEVMINGPERIFIEREGRLQRACDRHGRPMAFVSVAELRYVIEKIVSPINRKVDERDPIVDGRLLDGSRVNVVLNPVAIGGPSVTIRKFPDTPLTLDQLTSGGSMTPAVAELLRWMVRARYNVLVTGGTGTGKTTFLNALTQELDATERVVTVEDAAELRTGHLDNVVRLEARPATIEGKGMITIRDLVRTALRMRPDRIIVGEVRGGETLDMLQAMNTGHDGSLTTAHANSAHDGISRLETMALMADTELPVTAIRRQIAGAVNFIVHLAKLPGARRCVEQVTEITGCTGGEVALQDLFTWRSAPNGTGALLPTGGTLTRVDRALRANLPPPRWEV